MGLFKVVRRNKPDRGTEHHMPNYSIDTDNTLPVHPNLGDATQKEAAVSGAALAIVAQFSAAAASWRASRLVEVWNSFAGLPRFVELKEVKRLTDHESAVMRIWHVAQRPGEAREEAMNIAGSKG